MKLIAINKNPISYRADPAKFDAFLGLPNHSLNGEAESNNIKESGHGKLKNKTRSHNFFSDIAKSKFGFLNCCNENFLS